ncbi:alpha/beta hydrolase [Kocuria dechangensis]|uniref:Alpha/beta hydrolase n=1 Tax=Kocuria dechangensis TaxID=1176249 RepID=A0A917H5F9_9MICC|nr:alpha/beta hydrolase [Kocuria dechangensis]GGG68585.1 alpha/beta hydrolase [Kocuria dechangensis]
MTTVTSADGTPIGFDRTGSGPALVLVLGAFNDRTAGHALAVHLAAHFTVINYDRRGRGDSGDTAPYAVEREVEDLAAMIEVAGGSAAVLGYSSGAVLAMLAAAKGLPITKLALYDPPFPLAGRAPEYFDQLATDIRAALDQGSPGKAVELFQTRAVGIPPETVAQIRQAPYWPALEKIAPTLEYESLILATDPALPQRVAAPTLVITGSHSPPALADAAATLAGRLPDGTLRVLEGQTHDINPQTAGPVITEFLTLP